jgi:hydroxypyruvate reductase/glycerate 2-kinase
MNYREKALAIYEYALTAVLPAQLIAAEVAREKNTLVVQQQRYDLAGYANIFVFGSGKASVGMAKALEKILGHTIAGGLIVTNTVGQSQRIGKITVIDSSHPAPSERSVAAAEKIIAGLSSLKKNDLFIYLLSGGSSALVEKPIPPVTLQDMQRLTELLLAGSVPIGEVNTVRKHLSMVKGGRLAAATEAQGIVLVISDVIGDDLETIASAPLYCDSSTYKDTLTILVRYDLWDAVPQTVRAVVQRGLSGESAETPKVPKRTIRHVIIGSNFRLMMNAKQKAESMGMPAHIMSSRIQGEAQEVAKVLISLGKEIIETGNPFSRPVCLLFGGETTVAVRGDGTGGRNQELCLSALKEIGTNEHIVFLSAGTDGIDGNSDAAGAVVDRSSYEKAAALQMAINDYLERNDSYSFFKKTGDLIQTGPSGTNVMDLIVMLIS